MTPHPSEATAAALQLVLQALDAVPDDRPGLDATARLELAELARVASRRVSALASVLVAEAEGPGPRDVTNRLLGDPSATRAEAIGAAFAGRDLLECDSVRRAALAGELPLDRARTLAKAIRQIPAALTPPEREAVEADLVAHANDITPRTIDRAVRDSLGRVAPDRVPSDETEQQRLDAQCRRALARRHLRLLPEHDGGFDIRGHLPDLEAAPLVALINSLADADLRDQRRSRDRLDPAAVRTPEQVRADALVTLVRRATSGAGPKVPDRARVMVLMDEASLRDRAESAGVLVTGGDHAPVAAGDLRRLCCDADLVPVVLGTDSVPLDLGRETRLVTPEVRQALVVRDGSCVFPGCVVGPERCEAHHVLQWYLGGETEPANLALLCPHHHALVEPRRLFAEARGDPPDPRRWTLTMVDGKPVVTPPRRGRSAA